MFFEGREQKKRVKRNYTHTHQKKKKKKEGEEEEKTEKGMKVRNNVYLEADTLSLC